MKKLRFLILLSAVSCLIMMQSKKALGQIIPLYTFSQANTATYDTLNIPTVIASGASLSNQSYAVTLPFDFNLDNTIYNSIWVAVNGFVTLGPNAPGSGYWMINSSVTGHRVISAFDADLAGKSAATELSYQTVGLAPNRKFIIQWKHFGFPSSTALTTNFQIHLSETTGVISFLYGDVALTGSSNLSVQVGLRGTSNGTYVNRNSTTGSWIASQAGTTSSGNIAYQAYQNPPSGLKFTYTPPPNCTSPNQPSNLVLSSATTSISLSYNASVPAANGYLVVRTPDSTALTALPVDGTVYTAGNTIGNGTVVYVGSSTSPVNSGLTKNTSYTYTIFAYNNASCFYPPKYNTVNPLSGTKMTKGSRSYHWASTASTADFQVAGNWSPARVHTDDADTLYFDNGVTAAISNLPASVIAKHIEVTNNSSVSLSASAPSVITTNSIFKIDAGSTLTLEGSNAVGLEFGTSSATAATLNGTLILAGSGKYNARSSNTNINGTVKVTGANAEFNTSCTNSENCTSIFRFNAGSKYYHQRNGGKIPSASFDMDANVYITGVTSVTPSMTVLNNQNKVMGNLTVNSPLTTVTINLGNAGFYYNNVDVQLGSTGGFSMNSLTPVSKIYGNLRVLKGQMYNSNLQVYGNVLVDSGYLASNANNIFAGDVTVNATGTLATGFTLGGNIHQNVTFSGTFDNAGGAKITLDNPAGATLNSVVPITNGQVIMLSGKWDGPGRFAYGTLLNASLIYKGSTSLYTSLVEWPQINAPEMVILEMSGAAPYNRVYLNHDHNAGAPTLDLKKGVFVLGAHNMSASYIFHNTLAAPVYPFIASNGSGKLQFKFNGNPYMIFPLGDIDGGDHFSPIALSLYNTTSPRQISARVVKTADPNMPASSDYWTRYWEFDDNGTTPISFYGNLKFHSGDRVGTMSTPLQLWNGTAWNTMATTIPVDTVAVLDSTVLPNLNNRHFAAFYNGSQAGNTYTWNGSTGTDYQAAANWTPARNTVASGDILLFNNGIVNAVTNLPPQSVRRIKISNNTVVNLSGTANTNATSRHAYRFVSDNDPQTDELDIAAGSELNIVPGGRFEFSFLGTGNTATIAGKLNLTQYGILYTANCKAQVTPTGLLQSGGNYGTGSYGTNTNLFVTSDSTLTIDGTYDNLFLTSPGFIPLARFGNGSNVLLHTTATLSYTSFPGLKQSFYNLTYDGGGVAWGTNRPDSIRGTFRVAATGTGTLLSNSAEATFVNKMKFESGKAYFAALLVADSLIKSPGTTVSANVVFIGNSGEQAMICSENFQSLGIGVSNPDGIRIVGTGTLTPGSNLQVGSISINVAKPYPINTNLKISYTATGSLDYSRDAYIADSVVFPSVNGPDDFSINLATTTSTLTLPFSRTIPDNFKLQKGDLDLGANSLTLGTSATYIGEIVPSSTGKIRLTTGSFTRWFNTNSDQAPEVYRMGYFPIAYGINDRSVNIGFASATTITTGGTITVKHTNIPGVTTGFSAVDGSLTVNSRYNSKWELTPGNGLVTANTMSLSLYHDFGNVNPALLRVIWPQTIIGTHGTVTPAYVQRTGLTLSNLTDSAFHIGTTTANQNNIFNSVQSGAWDNPAIWDQNAVPGSSAYVFVRAYDTVNVQTNANAKFVRINENGTLNVLSGTSLVDSSILNMGRFSLSGGSLTLGPVNNCNKIFDNQESVFTMTNGELKVNGRLSFSGGKLIQTGGAITIRPRGANASVSSPALAVGSNTDVTGTGGTITVTDPVVSGTTVSGGDFSAGHELILGDSVSTYTSGNPTTGGFIVTAYNPPTFGSITIRHTPSVTSGREVRLGNSIKMDGNLSLRNSGAKFLLMDYNLTIAGNIAVDSNTTFVTAGSISFAKKDGTNNTIPQTVSGKGIFNNGLNGTSNANFEGLTVKNISAGGVTFDIGNFSFSSLLSLTAGCLNTSGYTITQQLYAYSNVGTTPGWVNGIYRRYTPSITMGSGYLFPIGSATAAKHVTIVAEDWNSILSQGYITVSSADGDHPNLSSSAINGAQTLNRNYTIDTSNSLGLSLGAGRLKTTFNYISSDLDPNVALNNFTVGKYKNTTWSYIAPSYVGPLSTTVMIPANAVSGQYQIGGSGAAPTFSQHPQNVAVCSGTDVQFTAAAVNANAYKWQVKENTIWSFLANSSIYSGVSTPTLQVSQASIAMNGFRYRCIAYNFEDSTMSNEAILSLGNTVPPTVAILANTSTNICAGNPVTFQATITNGGNAPAYQWKVNGQPAGSNQSTFTTTTLNNNDAVSCELTSNLACASPAAASSNTIVMTVAPAVPLSVTITSSAPVAGICSGVNVTFTATPVNGGATPVYQWKWNGVNTGTNSNTYNNNTLSSSDVITCVVSGSECTSGSTATSNAISLTVTPVVTPQVTISAVSNTICAGQNASFTATAVNGGTTPVYTWKVNGSVAGTNASSFSSNTLNNGDVVTCSLASSITCITAASVSSNTIAMTVNAAVTPTVNISTPATTICQGTAATFTASATNQGTTPAYQWKINGSNAGTNSATFSTNTLNNGDIVTCVLTGNPSCATSATANSNGIIMTVNASETPSLTITALANPACAGTAIQFTASGSVTGTGPTYQWKVNNLPVGTNNPTYTSATLNNGDIVSCVMTSNATGCLTSTAATSNTIAASINPMVNPGITISSANGTTVCAGTSVVFSATPVQPGTAPVYQWKKNNSNVGTGLSTYTDAALVNGDIISCVMTSNASCLLQTNAVSNNITMSVTPAVTASVSISATQTSVCSNTNVTFNAVVLNGGSTPAYQWKKNGGNVGINASTYADATLANGDVITCVLTSNATCANPATVTSNAVTMTVVPQLTPSISITTADSLLCEGNTSVTLNAAIVNGGTNPVYQWKKNNLSVGTNTNSYADPTINNGDIITCELTSNASCLLMGGAVSNAVTFTVNPAYESDIAESICQGATYIFGTQSLTATGNYTEVWPTIEGCDSTVHLDLTVTPLVTPTISISANPGSTVNNGQSVTFTASIQHGGTSPAITWFRNSNAIPGSGGISWQGVAGVNFTNGDQISARLQSDAPCATVAEVQSAKITMNINGVGIHDPGKAKSVKLFPNPTSGIVIVEGLSTNGNVEIYDGFGRKILTTAYKANMALTISLHEYAAGSYTLLFNGEDGKYWTQKVIRE